MDEPKPIHKIKGLLHIETFKSYYPPKVETSKLYFILQVDNAEVTEELSLACKNKTNTLYFIGGASKTKSIFCLMKSTFDDLTIYYITHLKTDPRSICSGEDLNLFLRFIRGDRFGSSELLDHKGFNNLLNIEPYSD